MPPADAGADVPPDPVCVRCEQPIARGTAAQIAGRPVHVPCLAGETPRDAIALAKAASQEWNRARTLVEQAAALTTRARVRNRVCPVCERPLTEGGGLLFQGDVLVHAGCWRAPESEPRAS